jgi:hypothetical protein
MVMKRQCRVAAVPSDMDKFHALIDWQSIDRQMGFEKAAMCLSLGCFQHRLNRSTKAKLEPGGELRDTRGAADLKISMLTIRYIHVVPHFE